MNFSMDYNYNYKPQPLKDWITTPKNLSWSEIEPVLFTDIPEMLKDLDLADQGEKMMEEQNRMIMMKHQIMVALTESSDVFPSDNGPEADPFDFTVVEKPDVTKIKRQRMENALRISALYNQQYRECAKDFLSDVIPAVKDKKKDLQHEIYDLQLELKALKAEYNERIRKKQIELNALMSGSKEVVNRFYLTDRGSAVDGGFIPCVHPEGADWHILRGTMFQKNEQDEYLEQFQHVIEKIENPDKGKPVSQGYRSHFRDGSGSAAPFGGVIGSQSDGNGLKGMLRNIFS